MSKIDLVLRELRRNVEYAHRALPGLRREVMKVGVDHPDRRYAEDVAEFAVKLGEQSARALAMLERAAATEAQVAAPESLPTEKPDVP